MRRRGLGSSLALSSLLWAGCAEAPFSVHAKDNDVEDLQRTLAAAAPSRAGEGRAVAYLVTQDAPGGPRHLVAWELDGGKARWDVAADVTSRLTVGDGFVAHRQGANAIAIRSASDGRLRCTAPLEPGAKLLGLAADARLYYVVALTGEAGRGRGAAVAIDPTTCSPGWRDEADGSLGAPAARGGVVAVPFAHQSVVLLDGKSGEERARVRSKEDEITFVRATPEGFFYGSPKGVYRLDASSVSGTRKESAYAEAHLAIKPYYAVDAYQAGQVDYNAFDRNRLVWRAEGGDRKPLAFRDGEVFLHIYRYVFGCDAASGAVKWAYAHARDLAGSDDVGPSILFASTDGDLGALDAATGVPTWSAKTGLRVTGATFDAEGFAPKQPAARADVGEAPSLVKQLAAIVWDPDARFTSVKVFAVDALAARPGAEVTDEILKMVLKEGVVPSVAERAAQALVARKDPASVARYREALAVRSDFLGDQKPRGVGALARVVAAVGDKESAPLLAAQLLDPATPKADLRDLVDALATVGGAGAIAPLRQFLLAYRCDASFAADVTALERAADGLLRLGGAEERRLVRFVAEDPRTLEPLAKRLASRVAVGAVEGAPPSSRAAR